MKSGDFSRQCSKCDFFRGVETGDRNAYQRGECRLNPPGENGFPEIYSDWWCGQFKPYNDKANKILNKIVAKTVKELKTDDLL